MKEKTINSESEMIILEYYVACANKNNKEAKRLWNEFEKVSKLETEYDWQSSFLTLFQKEGAEIGSYHIHIYPPLLLAIRYKSYEMVKFLVEEKEECVVQQDVGLLEEIISRSDPDVYTSGWSKPVSPIEYAKKIGALKIAKYLEDCSKKLDKEKYEYWLNKDWEDEDAIGAIESLLSDKRKNIINGT